MKITFLKRSVMIAMLTSIAISAFAEEAPVYDVDGFPPQFDGQESVVAPGSKPAVLAPVASSAGQQQSAASNNNFTSSTQSMSTTQRLARLEQQINNMLQSDVTGRVGTMQSDLQALRGQVDELTHQIQELQNQQKKMYTDVDKRLSQNNDSGVPSPSADAGDVDTNTETPSAVPADTIKPKAKIKPLAAAKPATVAQPNVAEEQQIYQTAYSLIKAKKYSAAAKTLQDMLQKYPSGQFAANAHYWLGELYGLMGKNDQAVLEFTTVVDKYPESPKIADSQLKLGLINAAQFKWTDAKVAFKKVISNYPGTASARLASEQLKQIKTSGH